jgi:RNA polymerase sigma factor (sigma-70 family)
MFNPFDTDVGTNTEDDALIQQALNGKREALAMLIVLHQSWIYNISFRMVLKAEDAEEITQEILIKTLTKLSTYDSKKGAFRTWLYRIVINHVANMKKRGYERSISTLENYYSFVETIPDERLRI